MRTFVKVFTCLTLVSGGAAIHGESAQELKDFYSSRRASYEATQIRTQVMVTDQVNKNKPKVVAVGPTQDQYGDPMYSWYGPLPVSPGTPSYEGPRYGESFSRPYAQPKDDKVYRGYARGAFSNPTLTARTDQSLGVKANPGYMQHGMQVRPGNVYPSGARAMINNP